MASSFRESLVLTLSFTLSSQLLALFYIWIRLSIENNKPRSECEKVKFTFFCWQRVFLGIVSSAVLFYSIISRRSLLNLPNGAYLSLLGAAVALDAWIERYPMELSVAAIILGWIASSSLSELMLNLVSTAIAFGLGIVIFYVLIRFTERKVIAWGDVMFAATLSSRYGFVAGISALSCAMIFAGLSSLIVRRINSSVRTVPLIPFMALAFSILCLFPNLFSF